MSVLFDYHSFKPRNGPLAIYYTTKSTTFGVGIQYQWININAAYTTETSALRRDANGTFEINLRLSVF